MLWLMQYTVTWTVVLGWPNGAVDLEEPGIKHFLLRHILAVAAALSLALLHLSSELSKLGFHHRLVLLAPPSCCFLKWEMSMGNPVGCILCVCVCVWGGGGSTKTVLEKVVWPWYWVVCWMIMKSRQGTDHSIWTMYDKLYKNIPLNCYSRLPSTVTHRSAL